MKYKEEILEYLCQPANMQFCLELEPLIWEAKEYKYRICFDRFVDKFIRPKIWSDYTLELEYGTLRMLKDGTRGHFDIFVYIGTSFKNNYYGVNGDTGKFKTRNSVLSQFKKKLGSLGMKTGDNDVAWEYFGTNRTELLRIPIESVDQFFEEWAETF